MNNYSNINDISHYSSSLTAIQPSYTCTDLFWTYIIKYSQCIWGANRATCRSFDPLIQQK